MSRMSVPAAIQQLFSQHLSTNADLVLLGETVGRSGGLAGSTKGLLAAFGQNRVIDTPISDRATLGMATGMAIAGKTVVVELSGSGRIAACFEVLEHACSVARRGEFSLNLTIRIPCGAQAGTRIDRSASELLATVDGLQVFCPWDGTQLYRSIRDAVQHPGVSVILEPRALTQEFIVPVSDAAPAASVQTLRQGDHITLVSWGTGIQHALHAAEQLASGKHFTAVVALHQLHPIDEGALGAQVATHGSRGLCRSARGWSCCTRTQRQSLHRFFIFGSPTYCDPSL